MHARGRGVDAAGDLRKHGERGSGHQKVPETLSKTNTSVAKYIGNYSQIGTAKTGTAGGRGDELLHAPTEQSLQARALSVTWKAFIPHARTPPPEPPAFSARSFHSPQATRLMEVPRPGTLFFFFFFFFNPHALKAGEKYMKMSHTPNLLPT